MRVLILALFPIVLAACGGGGGGNEPETGTFTLGITDASIDDYDEALLEVSSITLIGSGGQETEVLDTPQTIDLLKLRNVSELLLRQRLTARKISKIRLGVESIELREFDEDGFYLRSDRPPVPTRKIDLNPQGPLEIRAGQDLLVIIDVDLHNSIKINGAGADRVRFRPVVKIVAQASHLVRLYGTYTVDGEAASICDLERVSDADGIYDMLSICVALDETSASYFGSDGLPLNSSNPLLSGDLASGEKVSVYGYYGDTGSGMELVAEIIARGTGTRGEAFTTRNGIVTTAWDDTTDSYQLLPFSNSTPTQVNLSDGAKVFDLDGVVPPEEISMNRRAEARGALTDSLQAFITFVLDDTGDQSTAGTIESVDNLDTGETRFTLMSTDGPSCVGTDAATQFYQIEINGDITNTVRIELTDINPGDLIDASGVLVGACVQADTVIREVAIP